MSLTSYRAAPSRATNEATSLSPRSLFCFPYRFRDTAAGCSIPRHQLTGVETIGQKRKKADVIELTTNARLLNCKWVLPNLLSMSAGCNAWRRPTLPTLKR
jgi:hypothetical protein